MKSNGAQALKTSDTITEKQVGPLCLGLSLIDNLCDLRPRQ